MSKSGGRALKIGCGLALVALLGLVVTALLLAKPLVHRYAVGEAREHGFELEIGELDFGLGWVELGGSKFSLIGVKGIRGSVEHVRIDLSGLAPRRILAKNVDVKLDGSVPIVAVELSEWSKTYPRAYTLPAEASQVAVEWRSSAGGTPWLALRDGSIRPAKDGGLFQAPSATVAGVSLGTIGAAWTAEQSTVALGLGETEVERAPIRASVNHASDPPTADIRLARTELERLAEPFGVQIPLKDVSASGEARLVFQIGTGDGVIDGTFSSRLHGYVPPHPPEIDGFVFGDTTTFDSRFRINEERTLVTLSDTKVTAGAFKLLGGGTITRATDHAKIALDLRGNLPCDSLASAAAESRLGKVLGKTLGKMAGQATKQLIGGSVAVRVKIDADTRDLPGAKVLPSLGIGCGLKPLKLDIDLGKLPPLPSALPPLPSGLPPLPSGFPPPPKFELPFPKPKESDKEP